MATRAAPFDSLQIADIGDVAINPYNLHDSIARIEAAYDAILEHDCKPITLGGDHTIALPILRAIHRKHGKVALIHVDARRRERHDDGRKIAHGTPFRRAVEEGLLHGDKVTQIGLRGTGYAAEDFDWCREQGFRVVQAEECWNKSLAPLMEEVRARVGTPVYISFDIDGIDRPTRRAPARRKSRASRCRRRSRSSAARRAEHRRLRSRRSRAAVRPVRHHGAARREPRVRAAVRAAGRRVPRLIPAPPPIPNQRIQRSTHKDGDFRQATQAGGARVVRRHHDRVVRLL